MYWHIGERINREVLGNQRAEYGNKLSRQWRDNYKKNSAGKDLMRKVSFEDKELSIDRTLRMTSNKYHLPNPADPLMPNLYWSNELPEFNKEKLNAIDQQCAVDTVITHTSPSFCELSSHNFLESWAAHDADLLDDVRYERQVMDQIYDYLYSKNHPLSNWYYGHFHESWHAEIDQVRYHMLDIMELREIL